MMQRPKWNQLVAKNLFHHLNLASVILTRWIFQRQPVYFFPTKSVKKTGPGMDKGSLHRFFHHGFEFKDNVGSRNTGPFIIFKIWCVGKCYHILQFLQRWLLPRQMWPVPSNTFHGKWVSCRNRSWCIDAVKVLCVARCWKEHLSRLGDHGMLWDMSCLWYKRTMCWRQSDFCAWIGQHQGIDFHVDHRVPCSQEKDSNHKPGKKCKVSLKEAVTADGPASRKRGQ